MILPAQSGKALLLIVELHFHNLTARYKLIQANFDNLVKLPVSQNIKTTTIIFRKRATAWRLQVVHYFFLA